MAATVHYINPRPTAQILRAMRKRLESFDSWTQFALARDAEGDSCAPRSVEATCWCLEGAMRAEASSAREIIAVSKALGAVATAYTFRHFGKYMPYEGMNDFADAPKDVVHRHVLALVDGAIVVEECRALVEGK
jgi:hypothetical protein